MRIRNSNVGKAGSSPSFFKERTENSSTQDELYLKNLVEARKATKALAQKCMGELSDEQIEAVEVFHDMLPEGVELVDFSLDGTTTAGESNVKEALENLKKRKAQMKRREIKKVLKSKDVEIAIATDDSVWLLNKDNPLSPRWVLMIDAGYPEIPQE